MPGSTRSVHFRDPDGNLVKLVSYEEGRERATAMVRTMILHRIARP